MSYFKACIDKYAFIILCRVVGLNINSCFDYSYNVLMRPLFTNNKHTKALINFFTHKTDQNVCGINLISTFRKKKKTIRSEEEEEDDIGDYSGLILIDLHSL